MNNTFMQRLTDLVNANLANEEFGVEDLVREMGMSHSNLHRKLKSITNQTISQFIWEVRLNKAKEFLLNEDLTASEISYRVGFGSPSYFNKCFHEYFGYSPGELRNRESLVNPDESPAKIKIPKAKRSKAFWLGITVIIIIIPSLVLVYVKSAKSTTAETHEKSIAILPFDYLSADHEKQYLANGVMDAILLHLSKIKDLRVICRTSVEQYRNTSKTAKIIGKELDVAYILEGSFFKDGDKSRLMLKLINTSDEIPAWSNEYDRNWSDIFAVQSEIAETIASELKAVITPEEKQLIRKLPTSNLTAYDFYQRGKSEYTGFWINEENRSALLRSQIMFHKAIKCDSTYAQAYTGLARTYLSKHYWETYFTQNFLDSVIVFVDKALSFDNQLAEAYTLRGDYYREIGDFEKAVKEYDKAIKYNPNDWMAYQGKAYVYYYRESVQYIDNLQKAASLNHGPEFPVLLRNIGWGYLEAGFPEIAKSRYSEALNLDGDSICYLEILEEIESRMGNYEKAKEFCKKGYALDSTNTQVSEMLGYYNLFSGKFEESLIYYKRYVEKLKTQGIGTLNKMHRIGYVYWKNGYKEEAEYYFRMQIEYCNNLIKSNRPYSRLFYTYYDLAGVYAFLGDKDKAYENLRIYNQKPTEFYFMVTLIKNDPLFNKIRNTTEFQQIARDVNRKYQAEHERVKKWLETQENL